MIKKYIFDDFPGSTITIPNGDTLLVAEQNGLLTVWIDDKEDGEQVLTILPTGVSVPSYMQHVGSALVGIFVWHVYRFI